MSMHQRRRTLLIAPIALICASLIFMFLLTLIEPGYYSEMIGERDMMYGNITLYAFLALSSIVLLLGSLIASHLPSLSFPKRKAILSSSLALYLFAPVVIAIFLVALTFYKVLHNSPFLISLLYQNSGSELKVMFGAAAANAWTGSFPFALGVSWWAWHHLLKYKPALSRGDFIKSQILITTLIAVIVIASALVLSRFIIMPLIFGLLIVYLKHYLCANWFSYKKMLLIGAVTVVVMLGLFVIAARYRGADSSKAIAESAIGYGPASLNRCAAVLNGDFNNANLSKYLFEQNFGFISNFPFLSRFKPNSYLSGQRYQDTIYNATAAANLNQKFIWVTSYGEIFLEFGQYYLIYIFFFGFIAGRLWKGFKKETTSGVILYPWAAFNIAYIFGSNFFASRYLSVLWILVLLLLIYDLILVPRVATLPINFRSSGPRI